MKSKNTSTNLEVIDATEDDFSDPYNLPDDFWENGVVELRDNKVGVYIRLDADVLDWFKRRGRGYQSRINTVLRAYVAAARKTSAHPGA